MTAELIIVKDPRIAHAIVFGRGQLHVGVLVEPSTLAWEQYSTAEHDGFDVDGFKDAVWCVYQNFILEGQVTKFSTGLPSKAQITSRQDTRGYFVR